MVRNVQNYDVLDKSSSFLKPFLTKLNSAILQDVSVAEIIDHFNGKLLNFRLLSFSDQKIMVVQHVSPGLKLL